MWSLRCRNMKMCVLKLELKTKWNSVKDFIYVLTAVKQSVIKEHKAYFTHKY